MAYYPYLDRPYLKRSEQAEILTRKEEQALFVRIQQGDVAARHRVVMSHFPLVLAHVKRAVKTATIVYVSRDDLVQEGLLGLCEAIDRFDLARDIRFGTYAQWWVKLHIQQAIHRVRHIVRVTSRSARYIVSNQKRVRRELEIALLREPTIAEIGNAMRAQHAASPGSKKEPIKITDDDVAEVLSHISVADGTDVAISLLLSPGPDPESLAIQNIEHEKRAEAVEGLLSTLDDRERAIVVRTIMGSPTAEKCTLAVLASERGLSRERIRQLRVQALEKLRSRAAHDPMLAELP